MWSNYPPESLEIDTLPDVSHLSLNTSPLKHPLKQDKPHVPSSFGAPTLSLLPSPRKVETLERDIPESEGHGRLKYNWRLHKFKNVAREDARPRILDSDDKGKGRVDDGGLRLRHWTRVPAVTNKEEVEEDAEDTEPYPFARYTRESLVYSYSSQEYADHINDPDSGWSREETGYLFDLVRTYNARFYIILDRYEYEGKFGFINFDCTSHGSASLTSGPAGAPESPPQKREIEDLKDRYYSVVRRLIKSRTSSDPESIKEGDSLVLLHGFNREQEKTRREHIAALWARTPAQIAEETHLYTELLRLSQTATEFTGQRHHLLRLLAGIESGLPDIRTRDDRLAPLNQDPQIRGVKGAQWGVLNSAGPGGSVRKRRGGAAGGQSMDWADSPIHGNNVISLGSASAQRQLLPPAQQAEYDARHHIYRAPPGSTLINPKNTHTPVHTRSSKFPVPKPVLASYIQGYSQASTDAAGGSTSGQSLFTRIDVHTNKLAMPTKENTEWIERVFGIASQLVEVQRAIERVDVELVTQRTRLGLPSTGEKGGERKKEEHMQGVESSAPPVTTASTTGATGDARPLRSSSRKRTVSVSSADTSSTTHKRMKT